MSKSRSKTAIRFMVSGALLVGASACGEPAPEEPNANIGEEQTVEATNELAPPEEPETVNEPEPEVVPEAANMANVPVNLPAPEPEPMPTMNPIAMGAP